MIIELAFLLLNQSELPLVDHQWPKPPMCDDGSSPWHYNGTPNWRCELEGCNAQDPSCWPERLEHCSDDTGDLGFCVYAVIECKSKYACFEQFMYCEGVYECLDDESWIGCGHGRCTTDTSDEIDPTVRFWGAEDLTAHKPAPKPTQQSPRAQASAPKQRIIARSSAVSRQGNPRTAQKTAPGRTKK